MITRQHEYRGYVIDEYDCPCCSETEYPYHFDGGYEEVHDKILRYGNGWFKTWKELTEWIDRLIAEGVIDDRRN